ncbi:hypothetical protein PQQ96_34020 [Paraburkholderia sediminicola]|uniref:hypothetical protein n=1 Tax=Paraburkholderia sediminicola TaxID=458836 RepID=UPI0038BBC92C
MTKLNGNKVPRVMVLAFICSNLVIYHTGFKTNSFLFSLVAIGFVAYAIYYHLIARKPACQFRWRQIAWLLPSFGGAGGLSSLGNIGGGRNVRCVSQAKP